MTTRADRLAAEISEENRIEANRCLGPRTYEAMQTECNCKVCVASEEAYYTACEAEQLGLTVAEYLALTPAEYADIVAQREEAASCDGDYSLAGAHATNGDAWPF